MLQFLIKRNFQLDFFFSENLGLDVDSKSPKKESAAFARRNCWLSVFSSFYQGLFRFRNLGAMSSNMFGT